ncbi:type II toxin-antitoxin system Phd/YefM family antitoxin [Duganella radicis]|uniref:Antitoxin n=1 Tax=Duganella radicis TaxID=551988 RepID=A0A6L6PI11_9BURK|nr:type II toxin-antitoxin system Phd/YefM family antitoxin [Duganella radicis]MTV38612.1 type II toxin-antitoxin system prevent-host-death family antitoxin [Duganella radicis]
MKTVTLEQAQKQLDKLIDLIAAGEEVTITLDGHPVARMAAPRLLQQLPSLADLRARLPMQTESAGDFIRRLRDSERY